MGKKINKHTKLELAKKLSDEIFSKLGEIIKAESKSIGDCKVNVYGLSALNNLPFNEPIILCHLESYDMCELVYKSIALHLHGDKAPPEIIGQKNDSCFFVVCNLPQGNN